MLQILVETLVVIMVRSLGKNCRSKDIFIGIDPANDGSAVVLIDGIAAVSILWQKRTRKKKRVWEVSVVRMLKRTEQKTVVNCSSMIGSVIAHLPEIKGNTLYVACEDIYMRRGLGRTPLHLARFTGGLLGGIEMFHDIQVRFVPVATWRKDVLGVKKRIKRKEANEMSVELMPKMLPNLRIALYQQGIHDHISDAAGIALWFLRENIDQQRPYQSENKNEDKEQGVCG
jgi:hypothetical protein